MSNNEIKKIRTICPWFACPSSDGLVATVDVVKNKTGLEDDYRFEGEQEEKRAETSKELFTGEIEKIEK